MPPRRDPALLDLFHAKLASSGLNPEDAATLGLEAWSSDRVGGLGWAEARPALCLKYYDAEGRVLHDVPGSDPFFRLRYLDVGHGFGAQLAKQRGARYVQPPETLPCAYLPRTIHWADLLPDTETAVLITEGELKAACACKHGFPTIGLGGVWNFRSIRAGVDFVKELERFEWPRRHVYIVFDSDLATNVNVLAALQELSLELERRGALIHVVWLPEVLGPGEKVGLDDFLVYHGDRGRDELLPLLKSADPLGLTQPLFDLNNRYTYVADPGLIVDRSTGARHRPAALKEHLAAPTTVHARVLGADGQVHYKRVSAGAEWLKWPLRLTAHKITYAPGKAERFEELGLTYHNTWTGWGVEPEAGDVTPFLTLLNHLFKGSEPDALTWFLRWLAYPFQYPGTKLFSASVIYGLRTGTGKSLIGYTMGRIYGSNFTAIKQGDFHADFNEWAENKQFILGDDITGTHKREDYDVLKKMITQEKMRINAKYVPSYEVPDCLNYLFTSNQTDLFYVEDDDRRLFFHEVLVGPLSEEFYVDYSLWLDAGGAAAVFDYLLNLDTGAFNPAAPAYRTAARDRMINDVRSDLGTWCRMLLSEPDTILRLGDILVKKDLFTNKELLGFFDPLGRTGTTAGAIGRELRRAGVKMANEGRPLRWRSGFDRLYVIRNADRWASATPAEVTAYLDGLDGPANARLGKC